ncbi:MAG: hypothetical protein HKN03_16330 [Acidimicrobiales bacterium]|nr:hypothetical protein [Acidimicrobiales bacterium]
MSAQGAAPFHIEGFSADPGTGAVALRYSFAATAASPQPSRFTERIQLPPTPAGARVSSGFDAAARILLLLAGVSYFKSQAPTTIVVEVATTMAERTLTEAVYDHGLREFAYTNDLPIPLPIRFQWSGGLVQDARPSASIDEIGRPLVPFGGGKDSTVVLSLLPEATPLTINGTTTHATVAHVLGHQLLSVTRKLDRLDELTSPNRLNGHIPITAIVSSISVLLAAAASYTSVVMANEAAASEPTLWSGPEPVNHQWSKGADFEALFVAALAAAGIEIRYFSLLRQIGEPEIIALLARQTAALPHLISCNRAFSGRTAGGENEAPQRWCGECPKCLFTFLLLATELPPDVLVPIFGSDLLNRPQLADGFAALWSEQKPFECVGERTDAATALSSLANDPHWSTRLLVQELALSAQHALSVPDPTPRRTSSTPPPPPVPAPFAARLNAALGALGV